MKNDPLTSAPQFDVIETAPRSTAISHTTEHEQNFHPSYRPDIDGLRAVAILSVVIFHGFPKTLRGGFAGVDIFFVISGFLISNIIFNSLRAETFSFSEFYAHRIKRIFPALIVVLAASYTFGWFALFPDEFELLGKHIAAGMGYVQNFVLWKESGYFDTTSELKPLMHLWSLAIEEQFYLFYPLLIWAAWRMQLNMRSFVLLIALASFGLNVRGITEDIVGVFFLPQTRVWELLAGAVLADITRPRGGRVFHFFGRWNSQTLDSERKNRSLNNLFSNLGLFLIVASVFGLNKAKPFPGWWALLPVAGAFFLILGGPNAWVNRKILSNRVMVFIGLISYPLYLWHWPVLAFARIIESEVPATAIRVAAISLSFLLAWVTYRLVERPIRFGHRLWGKTAVLCALSFAVAFVGYETYQLKGLPSRSIQQDYVSGGLPPDSNHRRFFGYMAENFFPCTPLRLREKALLFEGVTRCMQSEPDAKKTIAVIGDSHGEHLFIGFAEQWKHKHNVVSYTYDCLPFIGLTGTPGCENVADALDYVSSDENILTIILAADWVLRWQDPGIKLAIQQGTMIGAEGRFELGLTQTLEKLLANKKNVYLVVDIPSLPFEPAKCALPRRFGSNRLTQCSISEFEHIDATKEYRAALKKVLTKYPQVRLLDPTQYLCDGQNCSLRKDGVLLYRDTNHLSVEGSRYVGGVIAKQLQFY